jgi:hypothetical protein
LQGLKAKNKAAFEALDKRNVELSRKLGRRIAIARKNVEWLSIDRNGDLPS